MMPLAPSGAMPREMAAAVGSTTGAGLDLIPATARSTSRRARPRGRSLHGRAHRPPADRRPSRDGSLAGPAGTAADACAERASLPREGRTGSGRVRVGRPRKRDGGVSERGVRPRLGNVPRAGRAARPRWRDPGAGGRRQLLRQLSAGAQRVAVRGQAGRHHLAAGALGLGHGDGAVGHRRPGIAPSLVPANRVLRGVVRGGQSPDSDPIGSTPSVPPCVSCQVAIRQRRRRAHNHASVSATGGPSSTSVPARPPTA